MSWSQRARASSSRLALRHGGRAHLVVVDHGALDPVTLVRSVTATVYEIVVRTTRRAVLDEATQRLIRSDLRTHILAADDAPAGVELRAPTADRTYRILAPADDAAVAAAVTDAARARLGLQVVGIDARETSAGEPVTISLEVAA